MGKIYIELEKFSNVLFALEKMNKISCTFSVLTKLYVSPKCQIMKYVFRMKILEMLTIR